MPASMPDIPPPAPAALLPTRLRHAPLLAAVGLLLYVALALAAGRFWVERQLGAFLLQGRFYANIEAELAAKSLLAELAPVRGISLAVAQQPAVIDILARHSSVSGAIPDAAADRRRLRSILDFFAGAPGMTGIALADAQGRLVAGVSWSDLDPPLGDAVGGQPYFRAANSVGFATATVADDQGHHRRFLLALAINDRQGRFIGAVIARMHMPDVNTGLGISRWFVTDADQAVVLAHGALAGRLPPPAGEQSRGLPNIKSHPEWPWLQHLGDDDWFIRTERDLGMLGLTLHVLDPVAYADIRNRAILDVAVAATTLGLALTVAFGAHFHIRRIRRAKKGLLEAVAALQAANEQLTVLATTDALTGAMNRHQFIERARYEMARATRYRQPLSLVMIDADHFKSINDTAGHAGGDAVLRDMVSICQYQLRETDLLARYGGEEFLLLLPGTPAAAAGTLAERLRQVIERHSVITPAGWVSYTVSLGVSGFDGAGGMTLEELMAQADAALYEAKRNGRNRVAMYAADPAVQADPAAGI